MMRYKLEIFLIKQTELIPGLHLPADAEQNNDATDESDFESNGSSSVSFPEVLSSSTPLRDPDSFIIGSPLNDSHESESSNDSYCFSRRLEIFLRE